MPDETHSSAGVEQFTKFWTDMMGRMAVPGVAPPGQSPEVMEQMRKTFFAALADHADQFMRSEQFLTAMKQSLDNSMALKQQVNQFLTRSLQAAQMPSRLDTDNIVLLLRGVEERVMGKLDELADRIKQIEGHENGSPKRSGAQAKPRRKR